MSDSNKPLHPKDQKRLKTRGLGSDKDYEPFVRVDELSSQGESIRVCSSTVGRVHHLLSGIELAAFLVLDWYPTTVDIREQFPIPIDDSLDVCRQLGIRHPQIGEFLHVVTTDLLIDFADRTQLAIAVKPSTELGKKRVIEKLQIEKAYWESKGVQWRLFTEREVPDGLKENLDWLRPYLDTETAKIYLFSFSDIESLIFRLRQQPKGKISRLCGKLDDEYQLEPGFHISVLRYAIAHHVIKAPIKKPFHGWFSDELEMQANQMNQGVGHAS
ncbi:TnsA endonuclease N-terminal domain-containing protein [Aeromonas media]|uniref:TnsA endonuclease N-terminal domain-containing protein n=1 Tax=Aeromonas media TaxID=651 RepID=UPI003D003261